MAVTVTDTRTIPNNGANDADGDATAGWTATDGPTLLTAEPTPVEASGCLAMQVSNEQQDAYFTMGASQDWSLGMLVYIWVFSRGEPDTTANGGIQIQLGDGTNRIGFHVAGSDLSAFRHDSGPVGWQCLLLDTANLPSAQTVLAGSFASLDLSAITQVGVVFITTVKSVGGADNMFFDVVRYGNDGLIITGGTPGDPGTFAEIVAEDKSIADGRGLGIIREVAPGVFGLQGPLTFGDGPSTTSTHFEDLNATVVFEDRNLFPDKYGFTFDGNSTGTNTFILGEKSGTGDATTGINGCTITAPPGSPAFWNSDDADMDEVSLYGCNIVGFDEGITLNDDATVGPNHEYGGTTFRNCGQVDAGRVFIRNCLFTATTHFKQDVVFAKQDDGTVFSTFTAAINDDSLDDVDLTPAVPVAADAFYIGHDARFNDLRMLISTVGTGTYAIEYWDGGSWTAVSGLTDSTVAFTREGLGRVQFTMPGDWVANAVDSVTLFWIRFRVTVAGNQAKATRVRLSGPADGSALLWNANINVEFSSFTVNADATSDPHAIEHPATGTFTYTNLTFSGNDFDIDYSASSGTLTITAVDSDPTTSEVTNGGGAVTINSSVTLTVTCKNSAGLALEGIRIRIEEDPSGVLITEGSTNGSGIYTDTYNYGGDQATKIIARLKGFKPNGAAATIVFPQGMSVPLTMIRDPAVNLP